MPVAACSWKRSCRMTSRVNQLHDELALESVTNIEFEQSSLGQPDLRANHTKGGHDNGYLGRFLCSF